MGCRIFINCMQPRLELSVFHIELIDWKHNIKIYML